MRYVPHISHLGAHIEPRSNYRRFSACPTCGTTGQRVSAVERTVAHIALGRPAQMQARVGVYRARCGCCRYFQAPIPGIPPKGQYSDEVRNVVANSLVRDRLPDRMVQERMSEDFQLKVSLGYIHACFYWAYRQVNTEARR